MARRSVAAVDPGTLRLDRDRMRLLAWFVVVVAAAATVERLLGTLDRTQRAAGFVLQLDRVHLELIGVQMLAAATLAGLALHAARARRAALGVWLGATVALGVYVGLWFVPGLMDQVVGPV